MRAEYGDCRRSSRITFLISTSTYGKVLSLDVVLNAVVLPFLVDHGALHVAIEEVERLRLITFDRETIAAETEFCPAGEVILVLRFLRAILKVPVVDRFRVADVVYPHDHWVHVGERLLTLEGERREGNTDSGEHK